MFPIRQILVPTDFTETSERAIDIAIEMAEKFQSRVSVMHAYEIPVIGFPDGALVATVDVAMRIQEAAKKGLDAAVASRAGRGVEVTAILRDGVAWEEIRAVAEDIKADLLVIGTHGRRGIARALLGSVAENVIRTCSVPVLTIHGPRE